MEKKMSKSEITGFFNSTKGGIDMWGMQGAKYLFYILRLSCAPL
jgi:hypothetical protein